MDLNLDEAESAFLQAVLTGAEATPACNVARGLAAKLISVAASPENARNPEPFERGDGQMPPILSKLTATHSAVHPHGEPPSHSRAPTQPPPKSPSTRGPTYGDESQKHPCLHQPEEPPCSASGPALSHRCPSLSPQPCSQSPQERNYPLPLPGVQQHQQHLVANRRHTSDTPVHHGPVSPLNLGAAAAAAATASAAAASSRSDGDAKAIRASLTASPAAGGVLLRNGTPTTVATSRPNIAACTSPPRRLAATPSPHSSSSSVSSKSHPSPSTTAAATPAAALGSRPLRRRRTSTPPRTSPDSSCVILGGSSSCGAGSSSSSSSSCRAASTHTTAAAAADTAETAAASAAGAAAPVAAAASAPLAVPCSRGRANGLLQRIKGLEDQLTELLLAEDDDAEGPTAADTAAARLGAALPSEPKSPPRHHPQPRRRDLQHQPTPASCGGHYSGSSFVGASGVTAAQAATAITAAPSRQALVFLVAEQLCRDYNSSGVALMEAGLDEAAREQLDKALLLAGPGGPLEGSPDKQRELQIVAHNNLACYYRKFGQPALALEHLQRTAQLEATAAGMGTTAGTTAVAKASTVGAGGGAAASSGAAGAGGAWPAPGDAAGAAPAGPGGGPTAATLLNLAACSGSLGQHMQALSYAARAVQAAAAELQLPLPALEAALLQGLPQAQLWEVLPQLRKACQGATTQLAMAYYNRAVEQEHLLQWQAALESYRLAVDLAGRFVGRRDDLTLTMQQSAEAFKVRLRKLERQGKVRAVRAASQGALGSGNSGGGGSGGNGGGSHGLTPTLPASASAPRPHLHLRPLLRCATAGTAATAATAAPARPASLPCIAPGRRTSSPPPANGGALLQVAASAPSISGAAAAPAWASDARAAPAPVPRRALSAGRAPPPVPVAGAAVSPGAAPAAPSWAPQLTRRASGRAAFGAATTVTAAVAPPPPQRRGSQGFSQGPEAEAAAAAEGTAAARPGPGPARTPRRSAAGAVAALAGGGSARSQRCAGCWASPLPPRPRQEGSGDVGKAATALTSSGGGDDDGACSPSGSSATELGSAAGGRWALAATTVPASGGGHHSRAEDGLAAAHSAALPRRPGSSAAAARASGPWPSRGRPSSSIPVTMTPPPWAAPAPAPAPTSVPEAVAAEAGAWQVAAAASSNGATVATATAAAVPGAAAAAAGRSMSQRVGRSESLPGGEGNLAAMAAAAIAAAAELARVCSDEDGEDRREQRLQGGQGVGCDRALGQGHGHGQGKAPSRNCMISAADCGGRNSEHSPARAAEPAGCGGRNSEHSPARAAEPKHGAPLMSPPRAHGPNATESFGAVWAGDSCRRGNGSPGRQGAQVAGGPGSMLLPKRDGVTV